MPLSNRGARQGLDFSPPIRPFEIESVAAQIIPKEIRPEREKRGRFISSIEPSRLSTRQAGGIHARAQRFCGPKTHELFPDADNSPALNPANGSGSDGNGEDRLLGQVRVIHVGFFGEPGIWRNQEKIGWNLIALKISSLGTAFSDTTPRVQTKLKTRREIEKSMKNSVRQPRWTS